MSGNSVSLPQVSWKVSNQYKHKKKPRSTANIGIPSPDLIVPKQASTDSLDANKLEIADAIVNGVNHDNYVGVLQHIAQLMADGSLTNIYPALPLIFNLNRLPYTLDNHFMIEPWFSSRLPGEFTLCTGRQVGKSMSNAAQSTAFAQIIPGLKILHLTPLYSQIHRFSTNYVKPFIEYSPIKAAMRKPDLTDAITQKNFTNGSILYFTFAFKDMTRTRGYDSYWNKYDEVQDMDPSFIPIINQTVSGAPANMRMIHSVGTPKTMENYLQKLLERSSWAEWHIKCPHCGYWNVPSVDCDLDAMIGPRIPRWIVSREKPGIVCANILRGSGKQCGKPLDVRTGLWVHRYPERRWSHQGYHVPQIILPQHCESDPGWNKLLSLREGGENMTQGQFYNEICGCSWDTGTRLVTLTDLKAACVLPTQVDRIDEAAKFVGERLASGYYARCVLGVDWGGGGAKETSFTTVAVCCLRNNGDVDVPFGYRSLNPHNHIREGTVINILRRKFHASHVCHDGCGSGPARETQMIMMGMPELCFVRVNYVRIGNGALMRYHKYDQLTGEKSHWVLDKARSLLYLCNYIRDGYIKFFRYDTTDQGKPGLIDDFLSLVEDKTRTDFGSDIYTVIRDDVRGPDDFTAATNYGSQYLWAEVAKKWPDYQKVRRSQRIGEVAKELINEIEKHSNLELYQSEAERSLG